MAATVPPTKVGRAIKEKTPEKIQPKTLLVAALTAITVAVISLQLTGLVSSLTLIGIASLLTAFVSEFYRVGLEIFHRAVTSQVEKILDRQTLAMDSTGELHLEEAEPESDPVVVESEEEKRHFTPFSLRAKLRHGLASRWAVPLLFALISFGTVGASFAAGQVTADDSSTVNRRVVQVQDLSEASQAELEEAAKKEAIRVAKKEAAAAVAEATPTPTAPTEAPTSSPPTTVPDSASLEAMQLTRSELIALIGQLQKELSTERATSETQADELSKQDERLATLERRLTLLEPRLDALSKTPATQPPTTPPPATPSPTP